MSARMPFLPLNSAQTKIGNAPSFIANPAHPLHRGSGQPDVASLAANPLPLAGLLGQRTVSHGVSASKNFPGLNIVRPQTTAPGKHDCSDTQPGTNQQTVDKDLDGIVSPTPLRVSDKKSPLLTSPVETFKTPARRSHFDDSFGTSPDHSTGSFGFSSAHIPTDIHQRGHPVRQLPSPDSSDQSGVSADHFQMNSVASFRTSTPYMRGYESDFIRAQRIFPQNNYGTREEGNRHPIQQQVEASMNRKRSRERYAVDNRDQDQSGKRQKVAQHLEDAERPAAVSTPVDNVQHSGGSDVLSHQCVLNRIFSSDVETFLQSRMEDFDNRVRFWQRASDEEWEAGRQGMLHPDFEPRVLTGRHADLKQRFDNMLQKTEDFMKYASQTDGVVFADGNFRKKRNVIATLETRIKQHQELLVDREKALKAAKENMLNVSQNLVAR